MSFYGGNQNGGQPGSAQQQQMGRQPGGAPGLQNVQQVLTPQLFNINQHQLHTFFNEHNSNQNQLQINAAANAPSILLQPLQTQFPVNLINDQLGVGVGQLMPPTTVSQSQMQGLPISMSSALNFAQTIPVQSSPQQAQSQNQQSKQRVFTGTVTKTHDNFGFIDEEVFFQMGVVKGPILPKEGDRVLVEADFNQGGMPFKWNATRVQIVNIGGGLNSSLNNSVGVAPPVSSYSSQQQHLGFNPGIMKQSGAPPPPVLSQSGSGRPHCAQPVTIVSNPHSVYSAGTNSRGRGTTIGGAPPPGNPMVNQSRDPKRPMTQMGMSMAPEPPQFGNNVPGLMSSDRDLDMDRNRDSRDHVRDRSRSRDRLRKRSRERVRQRSRERSRERVRDRSKERNRSRSRDRIPRDRSRERNQRAISRDRSRSRERGLRDRSPDRSVPVGRVRSRSRDMSRDRKGRGRSPERQERTKREKTPEKQRQRSKERTRDKEIGKEREHRKKSASPSSKSSKEDSKKDGTSKEKDKTKDKQSTEKSRTARDRSPAGSQIHSHASDRSKRSRSKDSVRTDKGHGVARSRSRSCSPKRKNATRIAPRYAVEVPKFSLDMKELGVKEMQRRYPNLYVPSDFFLSRSAWMDTFPLYKSFELGHSCPVQIMRKGVQKIEIPDPEGVSERFNNVPDILEPADASYTFKAKVMIPSLTSLDTIYRKACGVNTSTSDTPVPDSPQHVDRLISFIVGMKTSKHEVMALGGPWSPSLDGANPQSDPQTLINTATRCVRALTGINLSRCKRWFRFMELYYKRPNCLETVVIYLPDVWSCLPGNKEWTKLKSVYKYALHGEISELKQKPTPEKDSAAPDASSVSLPGVADIVDSVKASNGESSATLTSDLPLVDKESSNGEPADDVTENVIEDVLNSSGLLVIDEAASPFRDDGCTEDVRTNDLNNDVVHSTDLEGSGEQMEDSKTTDENVEVESANQKEIAGNQMGDSSNADVLNLQGDQVSNTTTAADDNVAIVEGQISVPTVNNVENIKLPTHFSLLSPKTMNVTQLREELNRRHISAKGLKAHLTSRLIKALKEEELLQAEQKQNTEETVKEEEEVKNSNEVNSAVCDNSMDVDGNQCDGETGQLPLDAVKNEQNSEDEHCIRLVNPSLLMEPQDDEISVEDGELKEEIVNGEVNSQVFREYEQMFSKFPQDMFPIIKPGMKEEDVKMWERRYALPKNPRLLAFPSTTAKSGNFDCLSMTLGLLRDYRIIDKKEDSFEVSLFSEFFYEMLQRDFAFRIYREIVSESKKASADETPSIKENEKDEKTGKEGSESATKKRKLSTSSAIQNAQPTKTTDPYLLLSFIFFDVTRCGYITETDLEDLCNSIGIGLTRAQIRKYVQKVVHKGTLYYRKWTDRPEKSKSKSITDSDEVRTLALGNRAFFPIFVLPNDENNSSKSNATDVDETANAVLAVVDGRSVDVKKLLDQLEKCEKELSIAESGLNVMKNSLSKWKVSNWLLDKREFADESKSQVSDLKKSNESLKEELAKIKEGLKKSESTEKLTKENFEVFKRSTERFLERVKDLVKFPSSPTKEKEKEKSENTKESGKSKEKGNVEPKSSSSE